MQHNIVSVNIKGGLGNQLFQIAAAYAYARQHNGVLQIIAKRENGSRPLYWDTLLQRIQPYLVEYVPSTLRVWQEEYPTMYKEIEPLGPQGIYLQEYLQTSKYYPTDEIKTEIKQLFRPSKHLLATIQEKYSQLLKKKERVVVMHARRTDYVTHKEIHGPLDASYYQEAVKRILQHIPEPIFLLCGDDSSYWNEIRDAIPEVFQHEHQILDRETDIHTFALLQQFHHFIMSNSTFIWWCVWLASTNHVFVPSKWFGPAGPQIYDDIYEQEWDKI